jgi:hypothetical protein
LSRGTTPTTEKRALVGFQHLEQPPVVFRVNETRFVRTVSFFEKSINARDGLDLKLTGVVEGHVGVESDFHGLRLALATQLAAVAIVCLLLDAAVDEGVEFCGGHVCVV